MVLYLVSTFQMNSNISNSYSIAFNFSIITECECNEHATKCYFSPYLYEATGNRTGGVCENCMHNTEGTHCESCLEGFYQDPALDVKDPEICKRKQVIKNSEV